MAKLVVKKICIYVMSIIYTGTRNVYAYNLMASVLEVNEQNDLDDVYTSN